MPDIITDRRDEAQALCVEISARLSSNDLDQVESRLERLGAMAEAAEDRALHGEWMLLAGQWLGRRGNHRAAERKALDAAEAFAAVKRLDRETLALHAAADMAAADGRPADTAAHQSAALALAHRSRRSGPIAQSAHRLALTLWELGERAEAELHLAEAYAYAKAAGESAGAHQIAWEVLRLSAGSERWHTAAQAGARLFPSGLNSNPPAGLSVEQLHQALALYGLALFHTGEEDAARNWLIAAEPELAASHSDRGLLERVREALRTLIEG